jgi:copper chaperone NosL
VRALVLVLAVGLALTACREERTAAPPAPVAMTAEALGHYCQMNLTEHPGPKAQVHLEGLPAPLFFSQVRDAIAYERMPEQSHAIRAIYVTDMAAAPSWQSPGIDNWVAADKALFVVGSKVAGGMGAQELVPFTTRAAAQAFVANNGGEIRSLTEIPDEQVLAPVEFKTDAQGNFLPPQAASDH